MPDPYQSRLDALFRRHKSVSQEGFSAGAYKPGLAAMAAYDAVLGHPAAAFRSIHVAGTNGKGTVCSLLAAALAARGYRVGLYTSPHLFDFRERIKCVDFSAGGSFTEIPKEDVQSFLDRYDRDGLSFFEITTGMAFWWFARQQVDVAVIEVGLGGRLDSTNILTPVLSVVTGIGLDHCALLGPDRAAVAGEKAGIFKPGIPALVWGHDEETDAVFAERALTVGCPLHFAVPLSLEADSQTPTMFGTNLGTARRALDLLTDILPPSPSIRKMPEEQALREAASLTGLRGRWESCQVAGCRLLLDIAHNPQALSANFHRLSAAGRPLFVVFGMMADKDVSAAASLVPASARCYAVSPDTPRAERAENLARLLAPRVCRVAPSVADGVRLALEAAATVPDSLIYVGGSTFVVSEALTYLDSR